MLCLLCSGIRANDLPHRFLWYGTSAKEKVVGWYHTGPRLRQADLDITELMARYCDNPLLVICEVQVIYLRHLFTSSVLRVAGQGAVYVVLTHAC